MKRKNGPCCSIRITGPYKREMTVTLNLAVNTSQLSFGIANPLSSVLLVYVMLAGPHNVFYSLVILLPSIYSLYTLVRHDPAPWPAEDKCPTKLKPVIRALSA